MINFMFTGSSQSGGANGSFSGGSSPAGVTWQFAFNNATSASFNGMEIVVNGSNWSGSLYMSVSSNLPFTGLIGGTPTNTSITSQTPTFTGVLFTFSNAGNSTISGFSVFCFLSGTEIATPDGAKRVEDLQPGDRVLTAEGGETVVKWLGVQPVNTKLENPLVINPICISAGALGDAIPSRDLYVSPDHAIGIDDVLVNASALVNGTTIYQVRDMPLDGFTYYHVETEEHELLVAEGCPAESFLDISSSDAFINAAERDTTATIREMGRPRISARRLLTDTLKERLGISDDVVELDVFGSTGVEEAA